jgi:hypothetical protein
MIIQNPSITLRQKTLKKSPPFNHPSDLQNPNPYLCYNTFKEPAFYSPISPNDMGAILGASNIKYIM